LRQDFFENVRNYSGAMPSLIAPEKLKLNGTILPRNLWFYRRKLKFTAPNLLPAEESSHFEFDGRIAIILSFLLRADPQFLYRARYLFWKQQKVKGLLLFLRCPAARFFPRLFRCQLCEALMLSASLSSHSAAATVTPS